MSVSSKRLKSMVTAMFGKSLFVVVSAGTKGNPIANGITDGSLTEYEIFSTLDAAKDLCNELNEDDYTNRDFVIVKLSPEIIISPANEQPPYIETYI